jgi:hypothetical protein
VLELGEDKGCTSYLSDAAGLGGDVLEGGQRWVARCGLLRDAAVAVAY